MVISDLIICYYGYIHFKKQWYFCTISQTKIELLESLVFITNDKNKKNLKK